MKWNDVQTGMVFTNDHLNTITELKEPNDG